MKVIIILATLALFPLATRADDAHWPRFRGPGGCGSGPGLQAAAEPANPKVQWTAELPGSGHSSPVIWGNHIFLTCQDPDQQRRGLVCLDATDGKLLWTNWQELSRYHIHGDNSFAAATPVADADGIYLSWVNGDRVEALAFDHQGKTLWQQKLGAFKATHGPGASPVVVGDVVVVTNDQESPDAAIHGLDRRTGKQLWSIKRDSGNPSYATPTPYRDAGGRTVLLHSSPAHGLTAIDPQDGGIIWSLGDLFTLNVVSSPVISGDIVFASAGKGGSREAAVVSFADEKPRLLYQPARDMPYVPTPLVVGDHIYVWDDRGTATCMEMKSGKVAWSEQVTGPTYTSPITDGKRIIGISRKGEMVTLAASPQFKELGRLDLPEGTHATPAIAHGSLYVRTFSRLIRFAP